MTDSATWQTHMGESDRSPMARTYVRTNATDARYGHPLKTPSVSYRAREIEVFHRSDMEFMEFLLTTRWSKVSGEVFTKSIRASLSGAYDQETERLRTLMRQMRSAA